MMENNRVIVITSGGQYTDIDTLACGVAYKNLLDVLGKPNKLVLLGPVNESVSKTVKTWNYSFEASFEGSLADCSYVLVDISDPTYFASFVIQENIIELYDHRWGFKGTWKQRLGTSSHIETVGSCATLIWEEFKKRGIEGKINTVSANLLYTAIVSNTLNFNAQITTPRDIKASEELKERTSLPPDWKEVYFNEIEAVVLKNPIEALKNDTKETTINGKKYKIGQIELWDSTKFTNNNFETLLLTLTEGGDTASFITSPSISQGFNYILCAQKQIQDLLSKAINVKFDGSLGKTDKLWLRKEIIRELQWIIRLQKS